MITSPQNPKLKRVRSLLGRARERREAGAFVIEGVRLVEEALATNWPVQFVLFDETLSARGRKTIEELKTRGVEPDEVSVRLMGSLSETETPQGILAVLDEYRIPFPESPDFVLIPDRIQDPGNLGTLLRSAAASGVQVVLIPPETTDPFSPKVLRSGMGAHFRLSVEVMDWDEIAGIAGGTRVWMADMRGELCWETDLRGPLTLIVGGEAGGASDSARGLAKGSIRIPMKEGVESLNAGVAGSLLMFEVMRQRSEGSIREA